jgi:hypothetical protein
LTALLNKPNQVISQTPPPSESTPTSTPVLEETPTPAADEEELSLPSTSLDSIEIDTLDADLKSVTEQFGTLDPNTNQATFNSREARRAGIDNELIRLAEELVSYQNNLVRDLRSGRARIGNRERPNPRTYPRLRRFQQRATERGRPRRSNSLGSKALTLNTREDTLGFDTNLYAVNTETACGNQAFPKPNVSPTRRFYNQSSPDTWLTTNGFHRTARYATQSYGVNYTRETFYSGVQGTCDSPKFRDDGTVASGTTSAGARYTMNLQLKEPNPEILESYYGRWPYLGWGTYVQWWHNNY